MKLKFLWLLLGVVTWFQTSAQFNPSNPPEPSSPPVTYLLTVTSTPESAASYLTSSARIEGGTRVSLSASANAGFVFVKWKDSDGNVLSEEESFSYVMPEHNATVTACFSYSPVNPSEPSEPVEYAQLNLSVSPSNAGSVTGGGKYEIGSVCTVSTYPNQSYRLQNWTQDGEVISTKNSFDYVVRKGTNNLVANYVYAPESPDEPSATVIYPRLYLNVNPSGAGAVSPSSGNMYEPGTTLTLQALPYSNYTFVSWTTEDGTLVSTSSNYNYIMPDSNTTLIANFRYSPMNPDDPGETPSRRNVIYGERISVSPGSEVLYNINLENVDAVTGINIDIAMPDRFVADYSLSIITNRTKGHTFSIEEVENGITRIQIRGTEPIAGGAGAVIRIPVKIPSEVEYGKSFIVPLIHGVVVNADGTQTPVGAIDGIFKIADELIVPDSPDFVITDVSTPKVSVMPGDAITATWKITNKGSLAATGGWSETISLINSDNKRLVLSTVYNDTAGLGVGEEVTRSATVGISDMPGFDGKLDVRIDLTPFVTSGEIESMQLNNTAQTSGTPVSLGKLLILDTPEIIPEEYDGAVKCALRRTGSWSQSETFEIKKIAGDDRLVVPESVTIRRDQSEGVFILYVRDNSTLDENPVATIEISGNGYAPVTGDISIEDNELAALSVEISNDDVTEGESFDLIVMIPKPLAEPLTFNIVSDHPARFRHPSTATIEAGATTATVRINSVDDDEIQLTESVEFTISANNYENSFVVIEIHDNDMPEMELTFSPSEVSESAGPSAVVATLRRLSNTDKKVTVKLSDNSKSDDIYYPYNTLTMERGVESIEFPFGVNNNSIVDGDRTVEVTAAVYVQACSCSPTGTHAGLVTQTLSIIDDDGPTLTLRASNSSLIEGNSEGIILTVTRNTDISEICTVTLSSDYDEGLNYTKEVVMAKGEESATVKVVAASDDIPGNSRTVSFSAESEGHSKGICWVILTDRTLPDAVLTDITLSNDEVEVNEEVTVNVTLSNDGAAPLADATKVSVYVGNTSEPVAAIYTPQVLNPGETMNLSTLITLPAAVGLYDIYAVVNERKSTGELLYTNNTSAKVSVKVLSPFRATLSADKNVYLRGEQISFNGNVIGKVSEGDEVEVYFINDGLRRMVTANVDISGNFTAVFTPYSAQVGHFIAGACYPGENLTEEMASFDVVGFKQQSNIHNFHEAIVGETVSGKIALTNPTSLNLTGVKAYVESKTDNIDVTVNCPASISSGETVDITYSIKGKSPSVIGQWDLVNIRVESDESAECNATVRFYCRNAEGKIIADIQEIHTTMSYEQPKEYRFSITNIGAGETGNITLSLPEWMKPLTPQQMPSLAADETVDIVLQLMSTDRMQLNVPVTGQIGINCENGEGMALKFTVEPVSETMGTLVIDVCDEYTYYTAEAPHVSGAEVTIMHPVSHAVLAKGMTDEKGIWSMELPEGYYAIKVTCSRHESYQNIILVDPGTTTMEIIDLGVSGVDVTYSVEETEVEDEYTVETKYTYSTEVPIPVIVTTQDREVNGQELAIGESVIINITVTNEGLITANDFKFGEPIASDDWELTFLGNTGPFDLPAKQSYTIPLKVTRVSYSDSYKVKNKVRNSPISSYMAGFEEYYKNKCGKTYKESKTFYIIALQLCAHSAVVNELMTIIAGLTEGSGSGDVFIPSGGSSYDPYYSESDSNFIDSEPLICDDEALKCADEIVKNLGGQVPGVGQFISIVNDVVEKAAENKADNDFPDNESPGGSNGNPDNDSGNSSGSNGEKPVFSPKDACEIASDVARSAIVDHVVPSGLGGIINNGKDMLQGCWKYIIKRNHASKVSSCSEREHSATDKIEAYLKQLEIISEVLHEFYGDEAWYMDDIEASISFFDYASSLEDESITFENLLPYKPAHISENCLTAFLERITEINPDNYIDWTHFIALVEEMNRIERDASEMGYESSANMYVKTLKEVYGDLSDPEGSVCSKVKLQLSQSMVMTRQAFKGTLTVSNGSADTPISNFSLTLDIRDRDGNVATGHEFQTNLESLTGFMGVSTLDGPWTLEPKQEGVAQLLFIPTRYAAETEGQEYTFSGVIHYTDPYTGLDVTRSLSSVTLTVNPSPVLNLTYFMQRDVYGDDPFTSDVIEPSIPGEFALVIDNTGYGDATNVRISTRQPEIIENEKGLLVDFELIASQVNGENYTLAFGESINSDFGTIPALSSAYAQWWLKCPLAGFFSDYDIKVNHVSSYGNEDLSLLNEASIHELIHGFSIDDASGRPVRGFLTNDLKDSENMPDIVYFSNGTGPQDVSTAAEIRTTAKSDTEYMVTVISASAGWTYGNVIDPTDGRQALVSVIRVSDGTELPIDNFWQTPYVLKRNQKPQHTKLIHMVVNQTEIETYSLRFEPRPELELTVESFLGVPDTVLEEPLKEVTVIFNKSIDSESFTSDDITLYNQGDRLDVSEAEISAIGKREYRINLGNLTSKSGFYILTVNTDGIKDFDGFYGSESSSVTWNQNIENNSVSLEEIEKITIYPLPMQDNVYVSGSHDHIDRLEFYDSSGILRMVCRDLPRYQSVNVSALMPDIYIVRILIGSSTHIVKVVKK